LDSSFTSSEKTIEGKSLPRVSWWIKSRVIILFAIPILIYSQLFFVVPHFAEVFKSFGADLPTITMFIIKYHPYFALFAILQLRPLVRILVGVNLGSEAGLRVRKWVGLNFLLAMFVMLFCVVGLYMPIFSMGSIV
jgi:type II secretory pathway component PulF